MAKTKTGTTTTGPDTAVELRGTIHVAGVPDAFGVQRCERCHKTLAHASEDKWRTEALLELAETGQLIYFTGAEAGRTCQALVPDQAAAPDA